MAMKEDVESEYREQCFILLDKTPGSTTKFMVQASDAESRRTWVKNISSILELQRKLMEGNC